MTTKKAKKIYVTDTEALQAAITETEGRATARTLGAEEAGHRLDQVVYNLLRSMPKKYLAGSKAVVHASTERLPQAYKYSADSTKARFEHDGKGWVLVEVVRDRLVQKSARYGVELSLTDTAKGWLVDSLAFV